MSIIGTGLHGQPTLDFLLEEQTTAANAKRRRMGFPMLSRLLAVGHSVAVHDVAVTPALALRLIKQYLMPLLDPEHWHLLHKQRRAT